VVASQPPSAYVKEHRRDGIRAMEIIIDPEELALTFLPDNGKLFVSIERAQNFGVCASHRTSSLKKYETILQWKWAIKLKYVEIEYYL
jgi:hypothetical protein